MSIIIPPHVKRECVSLERAEQFAILTHYLERQNIDLLAECPPAYTDAEIGRLCGLRYILNEMLVKVDELIDDGIQPLKESE